MALGFGGSGPKRRTGQPLAILFRMPSIARAQYSAALFSLLIACSACATRRAPTQDTVPSTAASEIAAARARSNAAIAAHDTAAIAREWMPDVHVVTSTGLQSAGAVANAKSMAEQFVRRPDTKWVREPIRITVFDRWEVASEEGRWTGTWTDPDGPVRITGTYLAQWRLTDGHWRIQAEVFVPLACEGGAYCQRHP
jgi:ketosteroid isomerase-like protein